MLKKTLLKKLYVYNMHIGHSYSYNSGLNYYILGKRFNFFIINMNKTFILLKKVLFFLKNLSLNSGLLLFHYSKYGVIELIYKCVLLSIVKKSNQSLVTYNWIYGSISNYFFSFFYIIKDIIKTWFLKNKYFLNFEKKHNKYTNYNHEDKKHNIFEYVFLTSKKFYKKVKKNNYYHFWYDKWIKEQYSYPFYEGKKKALKHTNFLKQLCLNDFNNVLKKKKMLNFKFFFLRLFYYINNKKKDPFFLDLEHTFYPTYDKIHDVFIYYWRFLLYFKHFNNYLQLPDALFSVFPNNNDLALNEFSSNSLVSIGLVDTNCDIKNMNYPIISNDDSLIIILFYFNLFSNFFLENKLNIYNYLKHYTTN